MTAGNGVVLPVAAIFCRHMMIQPCSCRCITAPNSPGESLVTLLIVPRRVMPPLVVGCSHRPVDTLHWILDCYSSIWFVSSCRVFLAADLCKVMPCQRLRRYKNFSRIRILFRRLAVLLLLLLLLFHATNRNVHKGQM